MNKENVSNIWSHFTEDMIGIEFVYDGSTYYYVGNKNKCLDLMRNMLNNSNKIIINAKTKGVPKILKELDSIKKYMNKEFEDTDENSPIETRINDKHEQGFCGEMLIGWMTLIVYLHSFCSDDSVEVNLNYSKNPEIKDG